jgi:hypothetical protein
MDDLEIDTRRRSGLRELLRRLVALVIERPVASVVLIALLARLAVAIASYAINDRYLIPDEHEYVDLSTVMVHGGTPEQWFPGYGDTFYESTRGFMAPLVLLFHVFGPTRLTGQIYVVVFGAAVAGLTVILGLRFLRPAYAVLAGLVVALTPSQVLFSSVVLREAHVWLALAVVAFGAVLAVSTDLRRLVTGLGVATVGLLLAAFLRDQTALAACWALVLAMMIAPRRRWATRVAVALAIAAIVPWVGGAGVAGWRLTSETAAQLPQTRAKLAVGAKSAFVEPRTQAQSAAEPPDAGIRDNLARVPEGLVDVTIRPFPWEATAGIALLLARIENLEWYLLYGLAAVGIVVSVRRRRDRWALQFPVLVMGMLVGIAALTQGNLGTAFRHRDQMLWALALCAAAGVQWFVHDSRWARDPRSVVESESASAAAAGERVPAAVLMAPTRSNR